MAASIEKLSKAYDFLRIPVNAYSIDQRKQDLKQAVKKDKIANLNLVYECIVSPNVRVSEEFSKLLSFSIEAFLVFFDDEDQDVYFVAEECLNKTTKSLIDSHLTRIQADLYKFIRKNGPERSLRGALLRFAELSHLIKPHKCRNYVEFLIKENTLAKIANRPEESIQNVLVGAMSKICSSFCWAMNDNELKMLIKSFLPNLSNESPANSFRRVSANCLSIICLYSRSPYSTYYYLHEQLLNLILPLDEENLRINKNSPESVRKKFTHWGVLICFRFMIIHLSSLDRPTSITTSKSTLVDLITPAQPATATTTTNPSPQGTSTSSPVFQNKKSAPTNYFSLKNLIQIYEICIYYLNCEDNRLAIASLECLQVLFKSMPLKFHLFLTKKGALEKSYVNTALTASTSRLNTTSSLNQRRSKNDSLLNVASAPSSSSASPHAQTRLPFSKTGDGDDSSVGGDNEAIKLNASENMSSSMDSLNTIKLSGTNIASQASQVLAVKTTDNEDEDEEDLDDKNPKADSNPMISSQDSYETRTLLAQPMDLADQLTAKLELVGSSSGPQATGSKIKMAFESDRSLSSSFYENKPVKEPTGLIGSFYSRTNEPLIYFVRLLSYKFLLDAGKTQGPSGQEADSTAANSLDLKNRVHRLKSDAAVKVLVKTVALDCCANAISIAPDLVFKKLFVRTKKLNKRTESFNESQVSSHDSSSEDATDGLNENENERESSREKRPNSNQQQLFLYELITYAIHPDDKMRMNACMLIGQLINAVLIEHDGDYETWLRKRTGELQKKQAQENAYNYLRLEILVDHLMRFIKYDNQAITNNMSKRYALLALHAFLPALFQSRYASLALDILVNVLHMRHSTYNLVKCELVDLIASCDFKMVSYVEQQLPSDVLKILNLKRMDQLDDEDEEQAGLASFIDLNKPQSGAKPKPFNSSKQCPQAYLVSKTQDRIIEDVFIYLLGSEDSKVRLETARSFTRFILNMSHYEKCTSSNQNILLANSEYLLKQTGFASNLFRSGVIDDNDAYNLNYAFLNHQQCQFYQNQNSSSSKRASQQIVTSPLSACSLPSALPWLSASKSIVNNNFIQPFYSLIKYWPTNASWSASVSNSFNSIIEQNLSYAVPLLVKALMNSCGSDKFLFVGCLETLDFIFQTYSPAIYFSSSVFSSSGSSSFGSASAHNFTSFSNSSSHQQITELLYLMISFLKYPSVAFDMYVQDIVMRIVGTLLCSYSWLTMRKLDNYVYELNQSLSLLNMSQAKVEGKCQSILDLLSNSIKPIVYQQCQAELSTGRSYTYSLAFNNLILKTSVDQLFTHCMRMLCVIACVIDESSLPSVLTSNLSAGSTAVSPVVPPHAAPPPTAPSAAAVATTATVAAASTASSSGVSSRSDSPTSTSSSSTKRTSISSSTLANKLSAFRSSGSAESSPALLSSAKSKTPASASAATGSTPPPAASILNTLPPPPPNKSSSSTTNSYLGYFQNSSIYLKMYETARSGYGTYKKSPSLGTYDKFAQLVKSTLILFAELLESSLSVHELVPHIDEILLYLRIIFNVEPSGSVKCVTMSLRALFGQNLGGLMYEYIQHHISTASTQLAAVASTSSSQQGASFTPIQFSLSSALSGSLPSIASLSGGRRRYHTNNSSSLFTSLVLNQVDRFSSFMMFAATQQQSSRLNTMLFKPSTAIDFGAPSVAAIGDSALSSSSTSSSATSSSATTPTKSSFSIFNILRKNKQDTSPQQQQQQQQAQQQTVQQEKIKNQKMNLKIMSQYIKSFESIVIKSLRQYTLTTSVNLQTKILELLNQLIYLKVDYSLLDSDKVFIEYVLKQFEHLEQKKGIYGVGASIGASLDGLSPQRLVEMLNEEAAAAAASSLSKSYSIDLYESFDSETHALDPLNPFDLDTMLNKLQANIRSPLSSSLGAATLTSSTSSIGTSGGSGSSGSAGAASKLAGAFGSGETIPTSPLYNNFSMKQQEHERFHNLIPKMFDFLILLSHERRSFRSATSSSSIASSASNSSSISTASTASLPAATGSSASKQPVQRSKADALVNHDLISVPEIIQYCDNLIASENSPHTHAIPALRPLVIDLFINRPSAGTSSSEDLRELEMHQDVVMVAMLRLIQYPQVWPLLTIAVQKYKQDASIINVNSSAADEKWKKVSRQISDALFDAMRSTIPGHRIRFHEFTGNELRAVRRYSRAYVPHIESLKQLFLLLNCLAEQVFRPIDSIILSLFELSKQYVILDTDFQFRDVTDSISSFELNNWLCICLVHLYLLFVQDANENILLIRLHHLMPQIIASYNAAAATVISSYEEHAFKKMSGKTASGASDNKNNNQSSSEDEASEQRKSQAKQKPKSQVEAETSEREDYDADKDDKDGSESTCSSTESSVSSVSSVSSAQASSLEYDYDNVEIDMTKAALFFSKFLLRILELSFVHISKSAKAANNMSSYHSVNLSSAASTAYLKDIQLNQFRDVNYTVQLVTNHLYYLVYILNTTSMENPGFSGGGGAFGGIGIGNIETINYSKMAAAIASLINNKPILKPSSKSKKPQERGRAKTDEYDAASSLVFIDEDLKFDQNNFTFNMNQMVLVKYSKLNPLLASTWQYLLMLCNYQDSDYWSSSLEEGPTVVTLKDDSVSLEREMEPMPPRSTEPTNELESSLNFSSNSSTAYNSLSTTKDGPDAAGAGVSASSNVLGSGSVSSFDSANITAKPEFVLKKYQKKANKYARSNDGESCSSYISAGDSSETGARRGHYDHELALTWPHVYHLTLNEQVFRYTSIAIYCEYLSTRNQLDNTTGLTMLIINNLIDLFEIASYEPTVLDMFSTINRNAAASSLFIQSINSRWSTLVAKRKLYLLQACLKSLEGVHLSASGHLLNLLIDKYFSLPYLSLVRHADHIACQRVEMMQSMNLTDQQGMSAQLNEKYVARINEFIADHHKYSYRHKRLISLIEQLQQQWLNASAKQQQQEAEAYEESQLQSSEGSKEENVPVISPALHHPLEDLDPMADAAGQPTFAGESTGFGGMKQSSSIDFFMLYVSSTSQGQQPQQASTPYQNLDKEWYYNIIRSACCHHSPGGGGQNTSSPSSIESLIENIQIKSKQCALMLSNLDYSNIMSIMSAKEFKLSLLKECLLLGASQSQTFIEKLPSSLKLAIFNNAAASGGASGLDKDFMHPLWLASTNLLFDMLNELCPVLPKPPLVTLASINSSSTAASAHALYEAKISEIVETYDFYSFVSPLTQAINAYLKCIRQYPCLHNQLSTKTSSGENSAHSTRISTSNIEKLNDLITFITFQLSYVSFVSNSTSNFGRKNAGQSCRARLTMHALNQSLLSILNLFIDQNLIQILIERNDYSALLSYLIKDLYSILMSYFYKYGDENLIHTPLLMPKYNVEYRSANSKNQSNAFTSDVLFSTSTFNLLLKLRYIITNYRLCSMDPTSSLNVNDVSSPSGTTNIHEGVSDSNAPGDQPQNYIRNMASCMQSSFTVSNLIHRFMRDQTGYFKAKIPFQMRDLVEKIYLSMCRLPIIDRFIRIPDTLWRTTGFRLEYGQFLRTDSTALPPLEYLRDPQILKEHLKHILCVGWTSRTQFEYEYVNMLTLLHNLSDEYYPPMSPTTPTMSSGFGNSSASAAGGEDSLTSSVMSSANPYEPSSQGGALLNMSLPVEEIRERNKCICLVIKGLSSWLIKASLTPTSGNSLNSLYEQVSRNKTPTFLHSRLGRQYGQLKTLLDSFNRYNNFTRMNSISIANNVSLLYMLDPTLIDEFERSNKKNLSSHRNKNRQPQPPPRDATQPAPVADALANLFQISMNLSHTSSHNILFVSNNERMMINNLPSSLDSYYNYTQVSLEGLLKFLGQWNLNNRSNSRQLSAAPITAASIAASISNFVGGNNSGTSSASNVVDEVSAKTANALNSLIKVAEFFTESEDSDQQAPGGSNGESESESHQESQPAAASANVNYLTAPNQPTPHHHQTIQRSFNRNNLDITSVLRTVLDYYESFFRHPCLQLKLDIFKSMSYLANCVFDSKQQYDSLVLKLQSNFDWLTGFVQQDNYNDQSAALMPIVNELVDDSLLAIGIYSECLCRCCLQTSKSDFTSSMSTKEFERLNRLLENGFRSNSLSIKLATVHGLIYWLESITLGYIGNNNDARQLCDHLCKQINQMKDFSVYLTSNPRYISALWSAVFYAIENCLDSIRDAQTFVQSFIKQTYAILNDPNTPHYLFFQLCMGLERFLLSSMVPSFEINTIQRLHSSKLHDEQRILSLTSLTITSVYAANQTKQLNYWNDIIQPLQQQQRNSMSNSSSTNNMTSNNSLDSTPTNSNLSSPMNDNANYVQQQFGQQTGQRRSSNAPTSNSFSNISATDKSLMSGYPQILELTAYPDLQAHMLKVLEVATGFLDKMKSSPTSKEASVYASILPKILCDFLPPHDLLNKLITEFLNSSQHPYPEAVAYVLYKCFDLLQEKGLQSQIQEWCLLSLSNFLQRSSIYESIWLTSCLLVSATKNQWLKSTFPFLLNRYCAFDTLDRAIFYMSVIEFRRQFSDPSQIQSINSTFESVSRPGTPYAELVKLLNYQANE